MCFSKWSRINPASAREDDREFGRRRLEKPALGRPFREEDKPVSPTGANNDIAPLPSPWTWSAFTEIVKWTQVPLGQFDPDVESCDTHTMSASLNGSQCPGESSGDRLM